MVADIAKRADNFRSQVALQIFQNGKVKKPLLIVEVVPNWFSGIQTQHYVITHGRVVSTNLQTWTLNLDFFALSQKLIIPANTWLP